MIDTVKHAHGNHTYKNISRDQSKDAGMAMTLICLIASHFLSAWSTQLVSLAALILVMDMVAPLIYKPAAWLWFGLAIVMGMVMSRVLLTLLYILVLMPVAVVRKIMGKDPMLLKKWKKDSSSVFVVRDHSYMANDIEHPY